ncbi:MAG: uracil phosphoribosyltransferase [Saprospirales bacterium]|nr:uracil phosphoribosyltransferase [Saprospirales bacterium]|tara:strand:+ start:3521 stop:4192 length:672 start_codon:yes stop_codon:yes gene_type:complete
MKSDNYQILNNCDSALNECLAEIRDKNIQMNRPRFRENLRQSGIYCGYELSKCMAYHSQQIKTVLGDAQVNLLKEQPVLIPILRAALPFYEGLQSVFPHAESGFIGAMRKATSATTFDIALDYHALPNLSEREVILIDPMLATGKSIVKTAQVLIKMCPTIKRFYIIALISSKEGLQYVKRNLTHDHHILSAALDNELNTKSYIVPGLGDAGDLAFGEKEDID